MDFGKLGLSKDATKVDVDEHINALQVKLKKLQHKEDEFNKNAALVPESDPNVALINDRIMVLKESVEKASADRTQFSLEYKKLSDQRTGRFLEYFDGVSKQVEQIYTALTVKDAQMNQGGRA